MVIYSPQKSRATIFLMRKVFAIAMMTVALASPPLGSAQEATSTDNRKVMEKVQPEYPELARRNHLTGTVKLKVIIAPDGRPKNVEVVGGNPVFLQNATSSVKRWKWSPADRETIETVEIKFQSGS